MGATAAAANEDGSERGSETKRTMREHFHPPRILDHPRSLSTLHLDQLAVPHLSVRHPEGRNPRNRRNLHRRSPTTVTGARDVV